MQEMADVEAESSSSVQMECEKQVQDAETQTNNMFCKNLNCQRKIKALKGKVKRRDVKIKEMKDLISEFSKRGYNTENLNVVLKNHFEGMYEVTLCSDYL